MLRVRRLRRSRRRTVVSGARRPDTRTTSTGRLVYTKAEANGRMTSGSSPTNPREAVRPDPATSDGIVPATAGGKASDRSRKSVSDHGGGTRVNKRQIRDGVYWMGAVDWERRLFDALIPLPDGTTYNAYLVEGTEKVALLDTVDPAQADTLLEQLAGVPRIDYLVSHHAEQDHSGSIGMVRGTFTPIHAASR